MRATRSTTSLIPPIRSGGPVTPVFTSTSWAGTAYCSNTSDSGRFGFAHSAGDSMSAILHDPDSRAPDRLPLCALEPPEHAAVRPQGWRTDGPGGSLDDRNYQSEEILATTLFRIYQCIGGDSADLGQRRFASRMMMYLILRAISTTPATNLNNALGFANALMAVDLLNWTSEGLWRSLQQGHPVVL